MTKNLLQRIVTFGEVMGRLAPRGCQRFQQAMPGYLDITFAGAEVNVAVSVAQLGGDASFVTALPQQALANAIVANLRALGVDTRHIVRSAQGRLGLFFFEKGVNQRAANVIYDREGSSVAILPAHIYDWDAIFAGASWFHVSGITPAISRIAADVAIHAVRIAADRGLRISFDMNFRSKLWQWEQGTAPSELAARTVREILPLVDLFFGGPDDVCLLTGKALGDPCIGVHAAAARQLARHYPRISYVAMLVRKIHSASNHDLGGMLYAVDGDKVFHAPRHVGGLSVYAINNIVDRLGGGDAFAAGLLVALTTPELSELQTSISFATAASCLAHSVEGDFSLVYRKEVEALMDGTNTGRVDR